MRRGLKLIVAELIFLERFASPRKVFPDAKGIETLADGSFATCRFLQSAGMFDRRQVKVGPHTSCNSGSLTAVCPQAERR